MSAPQDEQEPFFSVEFEAINTDGEPGHELPVNILLEADDSEELWLSLEAEGYEIEVDEEQIELAFDEGLLTASEADAYEPGAILFPCVRLTRPLARRMIQELGAWLEKE